jgi:hypothetical protein
MSDSNIKIYKVCLPSYYAWPNRHVILKVTYTKEEAEKFVQSYPHPFLKMWLTIECDVIPVRDTD